MSGAVDCAWTVRTVLIRRPCGNMQAGKDIVLVGKLKNIKPAQEKFEERNKEVGRENRQDNEIAESLGYDRDGRFRHEPVMRDEVLSWLVETKTGFTWTASIGGEVRLAILENTRRI